MQYFKTVKNIWTDQSRFLWFYWIFLPKVDLVANPSGFERLSQASRRKAIIEVTQTYIYLCPQPSWMPNSDYQHFLLSIGLFFADFCAATFIFPALSSVIPILLQVYLQYSLNIALELFIIVWTGICFKRHLKTWQFLTTWYNLMKQKHVMLCIVTAAHIYGYMFSFKDFSRLVTCYFSFFLLSKKETSLSQERWVQSE